MGVVYEAFDRALEGRVALKTLRDPTPDALLRLKTEFRVAQGIRHRNLVSLGELHEWQGRWFFTMELVDGVDLLTWVRGGGAGPAVDEGRLRAVLSQVADGLEALHRQGCIHRDVKPGNILVDRTGRAVILDFGVAHWGSLADVATGPSASGTAAYMAPEQAWGKAAGPAADWYSLGVILYEALTGERPFVGGPMEVLIAKQQGVPVAPGARTPGAPADLEQLCVALLRSAPEVRPTGPEIRARLRGIAEPGETPRGLAEEEGPFVGRGAELGQLEAAAAQAGEGRTTVAVVVIGDSGTGKSLLVRRFLRGLAAQAPGTLILTGACYERESVPFKAFDAIIDQLSRWWMTLPADQAARYTPLQPEPLCRLFPVLGSVSAMTDGVRRGHLPQDPQELRSRGFAALRDVLQRLTETRRLVLAIDDLRWADQDSLDLLRSLLRPPEPPALLLIGTWRHTPEAESLQRAVARFDGWVQGGLTTIVLGRLAPPDALDLARRLLAGGASPSDLDQARTLAEISGGHPLFIHELARHRRAHRDQPAAALSLDAVIAERTRSLDPAARDLVDGVSLAGRPLAVEVLAAVLRTSPAQVRQLAERLESVGLLRISRIGPSLLVAPYHDRVREAVAATLPVEDRREWHRRLAEEYERTGLGSAELLAEHLEAAGQAAAAARRYATAAEEAIAQLAFGRAVRLCRRALALDGRAGLALRPALLPRLAEALACAGRGAKSAAVFLEAAQGRQRAETVRLRQRAADQLLRSGNVDQGMAVLSGVLADLGMSLPSSPTQALVTLLVRRAGLRLFPGRAPLRPESEVPAETLLRLDVLDSLSTALSFVDNLRGAGFAARFVHEALRAGEPHRVLKALVKESIYLAGTGKTDSRHARSLRARFEALQAQYPELDFSAWCAHRDATAAFMAGRWAEAAEQGRRAALIHRTHAGSFYEAAVSTFFELHGMFYLGAYGALAQRVPPALAEAYARGDRLLASGLVLGLANLGVLLREGPGVARTLVEEFMQSWSVQGYHMQHYYALLARTHLDLYEGQGEDALARVKADLPGLERSHNMLIPSVRNGYAFLRARAALATAAQTRGPARDQALRLARRDVRRLARRPLAWTRALADLMAGGLAHVQGDDALAIRSLEQAVAALDASGMRGYAAAARARLGLLRPGAAGEGHREAVRAFVAEERLGSTAERLWQVLAPGYALDLPDPEGPR
jgi:serine/threonine protein kinase